MNEYVSPPPELEGISRQAVRDNEFASIGYFVLDEAGRILEVNSSGSTLLKGERRDLVGCYFTQFISAQARSAYLRYRGDVFENSKTSPCDIELKTADGVLFSAQLHSRILWESTLQSRVEWMTVIDISHCKHARAWLSNLSEELELRIMERTEQLQAAEEQRRAEIMQRQQIERSLRESQSRFRDFAEAAADWFWEMGPDLRFTFLAGRYREVMGLCSSQLLGRSREEIYADQIDDPEKWAQHFSLLNARRAFGGFEFKWVCPDGTVRMLRLSGQPMFDKEGQFQGYRGVGQDVTEYRRLEEQSRQRWTDLLRFGHVVLASEMVSTLLHELNQPLGAVMNYCAAIKRLRQAGTDHLPVFAESVEQAALQAQRAAAITHRLRRFFDVGTSVRSEIHLNELIKEIVALVQWEAREKQCVIETKMHPSLPVVVADRLQLEQVILNLLHNGMEAMGIVERREKRLFIRTATDEETKSVQVTVEDEGPGIDSAVFERMFEAFYTTKVGGLGLGLSISRTIIEAHGGRLWAQCGPDMKIQIHFTIPAEVC